MVRVGVRVGVRVRAMVMVRVRVGGARAQTISASIQSVLNPIDTVTNVDSTLNTITFANPCKFVQS